MLASLVLIVSSIGINIARYPTVGQLAQPSDASQARPAAITIESANTPASGPSSKHQVENNAVKVDSKPVPTRSPVAELVDVAPTATTTHVEKEVAGHDTTNGPSAAPIRIVAIRPLVSLEAENPFATTSTATQPTNETSESVVERLPPIDRVVPVDQPQSINGNRSDSYPAIGAQ